MVGVPRSKGCILCVKRRVKCDQTHPACGNCEKYGVECPGYERNRKFITGKHAVRSKRTRATSHETQLDLLSTPTPPASDLDISAAAYSTTAQAALVSVTCPATTAHVFHLEAIPRLGIPGSLSPGCVPFVYNMMAQLFEVYPRDEIVYTSPWFSSMLDYLDKETVLDTAMCAVVLQMVGRAKRDDRYIGWSRDIYGRSLVALQRALDHPTAWKSTETFAATIMCAVFELFAGTKNPLSWMLHAVGVSKLLQARGTAPFSNWFEKALLRSVRPIIISYHIFTGKDCFLNQPKWRKVSAKLTMNEITSRPSESLDPLLLRFPKWIKQHDSFFILLAQMPRVVSAGYNIREWMKQNIQPSPAQVARLQQQAEGLRAEFLSWYAESIDGGCLEHPIEVPSDDPSSPFDTVLRFTGPWVGAICVNYWTTLLILQECINQCQSDPLKRPYVEANKELTINIMRSLELLGRGIMGPYRIGYSIRVIFDLIDPPLQDWLLSVIMKHNKLYSSISSDIYPKNPALLGDEAGI